MISVDGIVCSTRRANIVLVGNHSSLGSLLFLFLKAARINQILAWLTALSRDYISACSRVLIRDVVWKCLLTALVLMMLLIHFQIQELLIFSFGAGDHFNGG